MTDKDTRVFMYRGQEARLFNSLDEVPEGEGWRDTPYDLEEAPAETEKPKRRKKVEIEAEDAPNGDGN